MEGMNILSRLRRFSGQRHFKRILLSIGTVLLIQGGSELALRVAGFRYKALDVPIILWSSRKDQKILSGTDLHIQDFHQFWTPRPGAVPVLISMPRRATVEEKLPILCRYSDIVNEIAHEEKVEMLDAHALLRDIVDSDNAAEKDLMIDSYHPTPLGHRILAEELR